MFARVPASSANIGPGFDSLGMAITLWAEVGSVNDDDPPPDGAHPADEHHLATIAFRGAGGVGVLWVRSPIPMGRGLGYSAAVRVGGLLVAYAQRCDGSTGSADDVIARHGDEVLAEAVRLEGHPDNAAPALLGGIVASAGDRSIRVPSPIDPAVVVWVPAFTTRTDQSRAKIGSSVGIADAVFNIGRTAYLVAALASGDIGALRHATEDRIHQPARFAAAPASAQAHKSALANGAWCSWLSGSGPSVASLCAADDAAVLAASLPSEGHTKVLRIDRRGATIHW